VFQEESLCSRCARVRKTCCYFEIYVTPGDVKRIAAYSGRTDFHEFRVPADANYLDQDDDPAWRDQVAGEDGRRRVLKRRAGDACTFLGAHGCTLPLEVRPLVCRLHPYEYTEAGISEELSDSCPTHLLKHGQTLLIALDMNLEVARRWHRQLYAEIRCEPLRWRRSGSQSLSLGCQVGREMR
jgi:Fe-S-cluster containining protein